MLAEALGIERIPVLRRFLGERVLDPAPPTTAKRPATGPRAPSCSPAARPSRRRGGFDERFFLFSEETDLCWRLKDAGWEVVHLPLVTIRHFESERSATPRMEAQGAYARLQFARKHFARVAPYRLAMALRYAPASHGGRPAAPPWRPSLKRSRQFARACAAGADSGDDRQRARRRR